MATKHLLGILKDANGIPLANTTIRFSSTSTRSVLNTVNTDYLTNSEGSYDFSVEYGVYTIQIKREDEINFRTVCANAYVYSEVAETLELLIKAQKHIQEIDETIIQEMLTILASANAAALNASASADIASTKAAESSASASAAKTSADNSAASASVSESHSIVSGQKALEAKSSADASAASAAFSSASANSANVSAQSALASKTTAEEQATIATNKAAAAALSEQNALASKQSAENSASIATTKAAESGASAAAAQTSANSSATSASISESHSIVAGQKALEAKSSADASAASAASSSAFADNSEDSALGASVARNAAENQANLATSKAAAAALSEQNALASKQSAELSASTATTKAAEAVAARDSATASASAASSYKDSAEVASSEASLSAATATTKATEASNSAASAELSKNTATTKAAESSASATAAQGYKDTAVLKAAEAAQSAVEAAQSAAFAAGALIEAGSADLSSGVFPTPIKDAQGNNRSCFWKVIVGGSVSGDVYGIGDSLVYSKEMAGYYKIDNTEAVSSVNGKQGVVVLNKDDVGLSNVDNTSDLNKPVSTATQASLDLKVDKTRTVNSKPLSNNIVLTASDVGAAPASHVGSGGTSHAAATTLADGFMSKADKSKLDAIAVSANNYVHPASGVSPGTYKAVTVDGNGHVTGGSNPTTVDGYGITDAAKTHSSINFGGSATAITTADFITQLTNLGAFSSMYWCTKAGWSYAGNNYITDTGVGTIQLAGCTVEVIGGAASAYTIRIHTSPTVSIEGAVPNAEFVYVDHGSGYSPKWHKIYNTDNKPTAADVGALPTTGGNLTGALGVQTINGQGSSIGWASLDVTGIKGGYAGIHFPSVGHWFGVQPSGLSGVWDYAGNSKWYFNENGVLAGGAKILWDTIIDHPSRTNWASKAYVPAIVTGQLAWKNYGNGHTIFDASAGTSPDGTTVDKNNAQIAWRSNDANYPTLMGWNGVNTYGVRVDSARAADASITADRLTGVVGTNGQDLTIHGKRAMVGVSDSNQLVINYGGDWGSTIINGNVFTGPMQSERLVAIKNGSTVYSDSQIEARSTDGSDARIGFHQAGTAAGAINFSSWGFQFEREAGRGSRANIAAANFFADAAQDMTGNALTRKDYVDGALSSKFDKTGGTVSGTVYNSVTGAPNTFVGGKISSEAGTLSLDAYSYAFVTSPHDVHLCHNSYYQPSTGWKKYDNNKPSGKIVINEGSGLQYVRSDAGSSDPNQYAYNIWNSGNFNPDTKLSENGHYGGTLKLNNWFRSVGDSGWYNETYGGGLYMTDASWVRVYNGKKFFVSNTSLDAINTDGGFHSRYRATVLGDRWLSENGGSYEQNRYIGSPIDVPFLDGVPAGYFAPFISSYAVTQGNGYTTRVKLGMLTSSGDWAKANLFVGGAEGGSNPMANYTFDIHGNVSGITTLNSVNLVSSRTDGVTGLELRNTGGDPGLAFHRPGHTWAELRHDGSTYFMAGDGKNFTIGNDMICSYAYANGAQPQVANALTRKDYVDAQDYSVRWGTHHVPNHTSGDANAHYNSEWDGANVTNAPSSSWYFFRELYHSNGANWRHQEAFDFHSDEEWFRRGINTSEYSPWHRRWHSGNFDPGTKMDINGSGGTYTFSNWVRTTGDTGWYNSTYAGGIYMLDTTWVRVSHNKKFYVDNTASDSIYSTGGGNFNDVYIRSDIRLKSDLVKIDSALDKVNSLTGYTFDKKNTLNSTETTREMGIIADDLNKVAPEAVRIIGEDNLLTISSSAVNALLIEAVKELYQEVQDLKRSMGQ